MRPSTGGSPLAQRCGEALGQRDGRARQLHAGCAAAADRARGVDDLGPEAATRSAGHAPTIARARVRRSSTGPTERGPHRGHGAREGRLERGQGELVDAQGAGEGVAPQPLDEARRRPSSRPACGPPRSLSPEAVTRSAPSRRARAASGSSGRRGCGVEQPGADVDHERDPSPRVLEAGELAGRHRGGEAGDGEVGGVHLEHERGRVVDRRGVVGEVHPVGRADLAQPGAHGLHQLGDAEAVADLDQLAAGDDHGVAPVVAARQHPRDEGEGGRAVVDDVDPAGVGHGGGQGVQRAAAPSARAARSRGPARRRWPRPPCGRPRRRRRTGGRGRGWCGPPRRSR